MESEPGYFDFFTGSCFIPPDQEHILENCPTLGELEVLYEEELLLLSGGQAANPTGVFMASPAGSTQVARNEGITPQETYHTPPEEAVPPSSSSVQEAVSVDRGCRDGERVVDLGRDGDVGIPERTERAVQQLGGADQRLETGKARGLERGPSSDEGPSRKPRLSGGNKGLRGSPAEGTEIMEVKLYVETSDEYADMLKGKLKETLEKTVESLKAYGPIALRRIRIHGRNLIQGKPNSTVKLDDAPTVVDLAVEESENASVPGGSTDEGEAARLIGTSQMARGPEVRNVADLPNYTYGGGKDLAFHNKGKEVAQHRTIGITHREKLKSHTGPNGAEMDCVRGVESVEKIEILGSSSGNDLDGQIPVESNCSVEHSQNMGVKELAQRAPGRVKELKVNANGIFNVLREVAEGCGGQELEEGSIVDFAKKLGITFPGPPTDKYKGLDP